MTHPPSHSKTSFSGLRPVNPQTDLAAIADLLEICFTNMDSSGRAALQEMRSLSNYGSVLRMVQGVDKFIKGLIQGFVWVADGQVVGNVSLYPAGFEQTWVIANVAVHPTYQRNGIAEALCRVALERVESLGGRATILQVDADNEVAHRLYLRLNFHDERAFTRWRRHDQRPPQPSPDTPYITYRAYHEWQHAYALAQLVRPMELGGLGWLRPTAAGRFRPSLFRSVLNMLNPSSHEQWVVRGNGQRPLDALLLTETPFASLYTRFDVMIHPDRQGELEEPLVNYLLRRAAQYRRGIFTEHPADDHAMEAVLRKYHFHEERHLIHMRWHNPR